jgi:phenylalanyl-tRNA synthetase beta chain
MTYPLVGESLLNKVSWPINSNLKLINSLSQDHDLMRPSLVPSLLEAVELNVKHLDRFRVFELGRSYSSNETSFSNESTHLAVAFYEKEKSCFIDLINTAENLLSTLNLPFDFCERNSKFSNPLIPTEWIGNHPFEFINIRVMGKFVGALFSVHPIVLRNLKIRGNLSFLILDLSFLENVKLKDKFKYKPLSKFPSSTFDWTVVAPLHSYSSDILSLVKKAKLKELQQVEILDVYQSNSQKFVTIRATLSDMDSTLSTDALKMAEKTLVDATSKGGFNLK